MLEVPVKKDMCYQRPGSFYYVLWIHDKQLSIAWNEQLQNERERNEEQDQIGIVMRENAEDVSINVL